MSAAWMLSFAIVAQAPAEDSSLEPIVVSRPSGARAGAFERIAASPALFLLDSTMRSPVYGMQVDVGMRGAGFEGVGVALEGQRVNDPQTGHHTADIPLTPEDIGSIEALSATNVRALGLGAIGGAVQLGIKPPVRNYMVLSQSAGSHGLVASTASMTRATDEAGVRFSFEEARSDGAREDTDFKKRTAAVSARAHSDFGTGTMVFGYGDKEFGAFDFYTPGAGYPSREWTETYLLQAGWDTRVGDVRFMPQMLWRRHFDKFMLDQTSVRSRYLNHHRTDSLTPRGYVQLRYADAGMLGAGFDYNRESMVSTAMASRARGRSSWWFDNEIRVAPALVCTMQARNDHDAGGENEAGGMGALAWEVAPWYTLTFSGARTTRVPSFTELYYADPTTRGAPGLRTVRSDTLQAEAEFHKDLTRVRASVFTRKEQRPVDWVKRAGSSDPWEARNIGSARTWGAESDIGFECAQRVRIDTQYEYLNTQRPDEGYVFKYGPTFSRHRTRTACTVQTPVGAQRAVWAYTKKPGRRGWWLTDVDLEYRLRSQVTLSIRLTNALNVEYQDIPGIPQPGRWCEAGIRWEW